MSVESRQPPRTRAGRTTAGRRRLRHALTVAAIDLFLAQGYDTTTVDEIAAAAGVGRRTFFRYFRSKEDAIFPDHEEVLRDIERSLATAVPAQDPVAVACTAVGLVLDQYLADPDVSVKRFALTRTVASLRDREVATVDRYQRVFARYLRERFEAAGDPMAGLRASVAAAAVAAAHNHVLRQWLRSGGQDDVHAHAREAFQLVVEAFSAPARPGGEAKTVVAVLDASAPMSEVVRQLSEALRPAD
ncbi:AcrR family transcriptional regulator [Amycolatopsis bartoniae]|uniref:TetR family transcriptional regulator n=1 Tax=Amycolatopsis bartoniae TaxID=941986 RepID=A0A8H9MED5_9PSEU|nr:TetR family transcriptional regulator [Amycolatopsis bartoniae]MBB2935644.1 AcrR family transcriptional regulator [Amycolatopsis bartoniae]TVT02090.1 TetR family transcriptional regulator [Amycolatopsis bartoniae]GHF60830.1 TetR family transcriptional regulator [Amycolatopsis bartoniae]